ncbi:MAG: hypothetical protein R2856_29705 [Caldilineaceae bacterium]
MNLSFHDHSSSTFPIHNLTYEQTFARIEEMIRAYVSNQVTTVNPEFLVMAAPGCVLSARVAGRRPGAGRRCGAASRGDVAGEARSRAAGSQLAPSAGPTGGTAGMALVLPGRGDRRGRRQRNACAANTQDRHHRNAADPTPEGTA